MEDARVALLADGVGGAAEEGAVVHRVLRRVAQLRHAPAAGGSHVGHPAPVVLLKI